MLYLMLDRRDNICVAKVGLSRDVQNRRRQYRTHNPFAIMRSECAGTENQEKYCHEVLSKWGKSIDGTEWYVVDEAIFNYLYEKGMGAFYPKGRNIYILEEYGG